MKKHKKIIEDIVVIIIIVISLLSVILPRQLTDLDELWNFNFAKNISEGRLPYKDFNMVQTPLLPIVSGVLLRTFGQELIVSRIFAVILNTIIVFIVSKILQELGINKYFRYLILVAGFQIYYKYLCLDYNFSVLLIILITILSEIKMFNKTNNFMEYSFKWNFMLGILVGSTILFKQTTGFILSFVYVIYKVIFIKNKDELKKIVKIILIRTLGICIPILLFIIYLLKIGILTEFFDYAIYGIRTFSNKISYMELIKSNQITIKVLSIILPIIIIYTFFKNVIKKNKGKQEIIGSILFAYSIASFVVVFPISDVIHFLIGGLPAIILLIFIVYNNLKNLPAKMKKFVEEYIKIFTILTTILILIISIKQLVSYLSTCSQYNKMNHFLFIPSKNERNVVMIGEYILQKEQEGKRVYILDSSACLYMIPIDRYNKDYDMFLKGNLGAQGEMGQIQKLENEKNIEVLILKNNYPRNWQNPEKVRNYIIKNWKKTGEILHFEIYEH